LFKEGDSPAEYGVGLKLAIARDWPIFSTDPDFLSYARILPLNSLAKKLEASGANAVPGGT